MATTTTTTHEIEERESVLRGAWHDTTGEQAHRAVVQRFDLIAPNALAVATTSDGHMVLAEFNNQRVTVLDARDGRVIASFGSLGSRDAQFNRPTGVAVDRQSGHIVVADCDNHRVQVFTSDGSFVRAFGIEGHDDGEFNRPFGVAVDPQHGHIVVSDTALHRVQVFTSDGSSVRAFGAHGDGVGELNNPVGVAIDPRNGDIVVADTMNHRLQVFTSDGTFVRSIGTEGSDAGEFMYPRSVAIDRRGRMAVADNGNERIQVLDASDGRHLAVYDSSDCAQAVAFTDDGHLIMLERTRAQVLALPNEFQSS